MRKGLTLCIQYHIWMKVTAVGYHTVYEKSVPEHHQQCHGNMETDICCIISSMRDAVFQCLSIEALNKLAF